MFAALSRIAIGHPWRVIGLWLVGVVLIVSFSPTLASVTNSNQEGFLPSSDESVRALNELDKYFPSLAGASGQIVVVRSDGGSLTASDRAMVAALAAALNDAHMSAVSQVISSASLVSPSGKVEVVEVLFRGQPGVPSVNAAVSSIRTKVTRSLSGSGLTAGLTGDAAIQVDTAGAFNTAQTVIALATILLIVGLLALIFRSPLIAVMPILIIGLVHTTAASLVAALAKGVGFQVGNFLTPLLVVVLFGVGTDYIVFLLFRYRERLMAGEDRAQALIQSTTAVGAVITSSAFTVMAAFAALLLSVLGELRTLAPGLIIAVGLMLLAALTLVPAVMEVLGDSLFWPLHPHAQKHTTFSEFMGRLVGRHPLWVVVVYGSVLVALAVNAFAFKANYDTLNELPSSTPSLKTFNVLKSAFPPGVSGPTQIVVASTNPDHPLGSLDPLISRVKAVPGVASILPPQFDPARTAAVVTVILASDPYSEQALNLVKTSIRSAAHGSVPGSTVLVGGITSIFVDVRSAIDRDLTVVFPVAAAIIAVILAMLLRAIVAPLYLLLGVGLGYLATLGASVLVFQRAVGLSGLDFTIPIVLYLFVVAMGTDYNILITARLREEFLAGEDPITAVMLAVARAGPAVAAAGLILAGTFASLILTGIASLAELGFGVSVGIVISAFVMAPRLVPSVAALRGYRFWWPSHIHQHTALGREAMGPADPHPPDVGVGSKTDGSA